MLLFGSIGFAESRNCGICTDSVADAHCEELAGVKFCQTIVPGDLNCNRFETQNGCSVL